jgi:hypothetical protein
MNTEQDTFNQQFLLTVCTIVFLKVIYDLQSAPVENPLGSWDHVDLLDLD